MVEWRDPPTLQLGHLLGQGGLLDASGHPKLLHDTLPHQSELVEIVPGLHHLALRGEAEDGDYLDFHLLAAGRHVPELSFLGASQRYAIDDLVPFCDLLVDADAPVGEGQAKLRAEPLYVLGAALERRAVCLVGDIAVEDLVRYVQVTPVSDLLDVTPEDGLVLFSGHVFLLLPPEPPPLERAVASHHGASPRSLAHLWRKSMHRSAWKGNSPKVVTAVQKYNPSYRCT